MFAHFDNFSFFVGYTVCNYFSSFDQNDKRNCNTLKSILTEKDHKHNMFFNLDPFSQKYIYSCEDELKQNKLEQKPTKKE